MAVERDVIAFGRTVCLLFRRSDVRNDISWVVQNHFRFFPNLNINTVPPRYSERMPLILYSSANNFTGLVIFIGFDVCAFPVGFPSETPENDRRSRENRLNFLVFRVGVNTTVEKERSENKNFELV